MVKELANFTLLGTLLTLLYMLCTNKDDELDGCSRDLVSMHTFLLNLVITLGLFRSSYARSSGTKRLKLVTVTK